MPSLQREGTSLFYEQAGSGDPPLVLVHGWACNKDHMRPQFEHFGLFHQVVAVDLRGHGRSDKPEQPYTIAGFADDLGWLCAELDIELPVVIGHSMGGAIALELAAQHSERLAGIVLLDTAVLPAPEAWAGVQPVIAALKTPDYRDAVARFLADVFFQPTDDRQRKAWIIESMLECPQHVMSSAFEGIFAWDSAEAIAKCKVPALYVGSTRPRGDVQHFRALCPQLVSGSVVSAGHFVQTEVPDQVNAMIARFLEVDLR